MPRTSWSIPNSPRDASSTGLALSGGRMWWAAPIVAWADGCMPKLAGRSSRRLPKGRLSRRKPCGIDGQPFCKRHGFPPRQPSARQQGTASTQPGQIVSARFEGAHFRRPCEVARFPPMAGSVGRDNMGVGGVRRIEVTERERPLFGGTEFGAVGPYERLHGTIFGELDPTHPLNVGIVNLDRAARNAHGNVEYQSDFRILKPLDLDRGNGCLVYDVPNRGNQPIMPRLNGVPDGGHPQNAGNLFLMQPGFTVVWSGWQGDVPPGADRLTARFPTIRGITGMVREEFIAEATGLLGDSNIQELSEERFVGTLVYPVADPDGATLTVRQREG